MELSYIKRLLATNQIEQAIRQIEDKVNGLDDMDLANEFILISNQFIRSKKDKMLGISNDEFITNKIIFSLIDFVDRLDNVKSVECAENEDSNDIGVISKEEKNKISFNAIKRLQFTYEENEKFIDFFKGIDNQIRKILISNAFDSELVEEFRCRLENCIKKLALLKNKIKILKNTLEFYEETNFFIISFLLKLAGISRIQSQLHSQAKKVLHYCEYEMTIIEIEHESENINYFITRINGPYRAWRKIKIGLVLIFLISLLFLFVKK